MFSFAPLITFSLCSLFLLMGCASPDAHRARADKKVYEILGGVQEEVFGARKAGFTIDQPNSKLPLSEVTNASILRKSNTTGEITLSLQQALDYAVTHSRTYQSEKESLYLSALSLSDAQDNYALTPSSSWGATHNKRASGVESLNVGGTNSLSKLLKGGANLSVSLANDLLTYFTGNGTDSITSLISFNIMQPLLRGRGSEIAAEQLTQSYRNVIYEVRNFSTYQQSFSREIVLDYLQLLQLEERIKNQYKNLQSRKANYEYLQARAIDRAKPSEVADAKQNMLRAETSHISAQSSYANALDSFKIKLGMPSSTHLNLVPQELDAIVNAGLLRIAYSEQQAYQHALQHRTALLNEIDQFEDVRRDVIIAADRLGTQLNFVTNMSLNDSGDRWHKFNFDDLSTRIGLQLDLPVNRKSQRSSYRRALISFDARARRLSQRHDELKNLVQRRYRELDQYRSNYEIQLGALALAQRRVEENELRLRMGTLIFRRLSESQDALIAAQNAVTSALINYQESRLRLYEDIGMLNVEQRKFWLK